MFSGYSQSSILPGSAAMVVPPASPYHHSYGESMKKSLECELQKLNHTFREKANFQTTSTTRSIFLILTAFAYVDADDRPMVLI